MKTDVRRYFHSYILLQGISNSMFTRAANELSRGGITDMDTLCKLLEENPKELLEIRNIGEKSIAMSRAVCEAYCQERGGTA